FFINRRISVRFFRKPFAFFGNRSVVFGTVRSAGRTAATGTVLAVLVATSLILLRIGIQGCLDEAETHLGNLIHLRQLFARRIGENGRKKVTPLFAAEQLNLRKEIVAQDERIYFLFRHVIFDVVSDDIRRRG